MTWTRRKFLQTSAASAAAFAFGWNPVTEFHRPVGELFPYDDEALLRELSSVALQAAREAGAEYADVRFGRIRMLRAAMNQMVVDMPGRRNLIDVGVRVLVNNNWGFAARATRDRNEVAKLARNAVYHAKSTAWPGRQAVELAPAPKVPDGKWHMPIKVDPFELSIEEMMADIRPAHELAMKSKRVTSVHTNFTFVRRDESFASTDGSYIEQRTYMTFGPSANGVVWVLTGDPVKFEGVHGVAPFFWQHGAGYEVVKNANYPSHIPRMIEDAVVKLEAPEVEPGQYEVVLDGTAMATILSTTYGHHTQIDRALGLEANVMGTTWVAPPNEALGRMKLGNELLTVKCNRNHPESPCNVKWDSEGVETEEFTVVDQGVLVDYQTTREQVAWMKDYYQATKREMRSHGCAGSLSAGMIQIQMVPNIFIPPPETDTKLDDLLQGIERGIYMRDAAASTDQGGVTGQSGGDSAQTYEIRKGKLGRRVRNAMVIFKTQDFFKNIKAFGGRSTYEFRSQVQFSKGEPYQGWPCGGGAPAARIKNVAVTNIRGQGA